MVRFFASVLVAALVALGFGLFTRAQPAPAPAEAPIWRDIDISGLPLVNPKADRAPPSALGRTSHNPTLSLKSPFLDINLNDPEFPRGWYAAGRVENKRGLSAEELARFLDHLCWRLGEAEFYHESDLNVMRMRSSEQRFRTVTRVVDYIRGWYSAAVHCDVYELPVPRKDARVAAPDVPELVASANPLASLQGGIGEPMLLRQWRPLSYLATYYYRMLTNEVAEPGVATIQDGSELAVNVMPGPGGEVWLNASFGLLKLESMRKVPAFVGEVEAPQFATRDVSLAIRLKAGEAAILDDRLLLVPRISSAPPLVDTSESGIWMATAFTQAMPGMRFAPWPGTSLELPGLDEDRELTTGSWPQPAWADNAVVDYDHQQERFIARLDGFEHWEAAGWAMFVPPPEGAGARERLEAAVRAGTSGSVFRAALYIIAAKDLPREAMGAPTAADMEVIASAATGTVAGNLGTFAGSVATLFSGQGASYLKSARPSYTAEVGVISPKMYTAFGGLRVDLRARHVGDDCLVSADAVWGTAPSPAPFGVPIGDTVAVLEGARVATAAFSVRATLKRGELAGQVMPHPTDAAQRLVLVIRREE